MDGVIEAGKEIVHAQFPPGSANCFRVIQYIAEVEMD